MQDEKAYKEELKANGVEIDGLETEETQKEEEPKIEEETQEEEKENEEESTLKDNQKVNRSIYDEYKDKKSQLKSEKELREKAERERDELKEKLEAINNAGNSSDRKDAIDEFEEFASEINADPKTLKKMRDLFQKGTKSEVDENLKKDLEEFKSWKEQNKEIIEKQKFEEEFKKTLPSIKEFLPKASEEEMNSIKERLVELSNSKDWQGQSLDYVAFKNKSELSQLISPRKKGLETKERKDDVDSSFEFNPDADYASMTPQQRDEWEKNYNRAMKGSDLNKTRNLLI